MPVSATVSGEFVALLVTVRLPAKVPAEVGVQVIPSEVDWPAASVTGSDMESALNGEPLAEIWEIVTVEFPVLVTVTACEAEAPVARLPKLKDVGLADS